MIIIRSRVDSSDVNALFASLEESCCSLLIMSTHTADYHYPASGCPCIFFAIQGWKIAGMARDQTHNIKYKHSVVPFPHPIGVHVSGSHHPKSVFFGWIGGTFPQTFWWTLGCSLSTTCSRVKNLGCTWQGLQIPIGWRRREVHAILTICS